MLSLLTKGLPQTTVRFWRAFVAAAGVAVVSAALYRAPDWLETWSTTAAIGAMSLAVVLLILAIGIAVRGSAHVVKRVATEICFLAVALIAAEAVFLARSSDRWSDNPLVQRLTAQELAATDLGIAYDRRLIADVVDDRRMQGLDAVPAFAPPTGAQNDAVAAVISERGLLPLSNVSNAHVVECNEGPGYVEFRSDEFGFNNPPAIASGSIDVAVVGESLAVGHCVPPTHSAVAQIRARFPRTANFGIAGSRVLSQLGVFREYVEPAEPPIVVWFVNPAYAEARDEAYQPVLLKYLKDASFSQCLRRRQDEVDAFVRELLIPLALRSDEALRHELEASRQFPVARLLKLRNVRSLVDFERPAQPQLATARSLGHFKKTMNLVAHTANAWGGRVIVVIAPSNEVRDRPEPVARYHAVLDALAGADVDVVDGVALFAAQPDIRSLYTLGIDNHPSDRGHALLAEAVVAAIEHTGAL